MMPQALSKMTKPTHTTSPSRTSGISMTRLKGTLALNWSVAPVSTLLM